MATSLTCEVYAEAVRVPDGAERPVVPGDPFALAGLSLSWGRSTTVDQPQASTCTFEVADEPGARTFTDLFTVGTAVQVKATGTVYADPTLSTFTDPGFEAAAPYTTAVVRAAVTRSTRRASAGTHAARIQPTGTGTASVVFAPAPFVAAGTNPDAWDAIPATAVGQRWSYGAAVFVPAGAKAVLTPVLFSGPYATAWEAVPGAAPLTVNGDGAWHTVSGPVVPAKAARWVGVQVTVNPTGYTWDGHPAGTWDGQAAGWLWDDHGAVFVDTVAVLAPVGGTASTVLVYAGRVTDLELAYDDSIPAPVYKVTAADFTADLDNTDVGDEPWAVETLSARFNRILGLTGLPITATIDASIAGTLVTWRDVDRQPATGLLADLAASVDGVMWSATHQVSGPYLRVEDPLNRAPGSTLQLVGGVVVIVPTSTGGLALSACDVLRDPVSYVENVSDVATRVAVTWQQQVAGPPISTDEQTVTVVDASREGYGPGRYGTRRYGVSTQLQASADALAVANRILNRTVVGWRAAGLSIDTADLIADDSDPNAATNEVLTLLDGTSRNGLLLRLTDLPDWAPNHPASAVYLEGGQYRFNDGRWVLELVASAAKNLGQSVTWNQPPVAWTWNQFDPTIRWNDLAGVGVSP
jgi:hypothetical protein